VTIFFVVTQKIGKTLGTAVSSFMAEVAGLKRGRICSLAPLMVNFPAFLIRKKPPRKNVTASLP